MVLNCHIAVTVVSVSGHNYVVVTNHNKNRITMPQRPHHNTATTASTRIKLQEIMKCSQKLLGLSSFLLIS